MSSKKIQILDVSSRDGSYALNFQITPHNVATIVDYLDYAGIPYIEIGHGSGLGFSKLGYPSAASNLEYAHAAKVMKKKSKIGVLSPSLNLVLPELEEIAPHIDFVRFAVMPRETKKAEKLIQKSKKLNLEVFVQLSRASLLNPEELLEEAKKAENMGVNVVYIVDTIGNFTPESTKAYFSTLKNKIHTPLGFHAHNNLGLANINALTAIEEGCEWVDACMQGVGRQSGNTQLETIASLLEKKGYRTELNIPLLLDVAETIIKDIFQNTIKGASAFEIRSALANIDMYPEPIFRKLALALGYTLDELIQQISEIKNFVTLDESHIKLLAKKAGRTYSEVIQMLQ